MNDVQYIGKEEIPPSICMTFIQLVIQFKELP